MTNKPKRPRPQCNCEQHEPCPCHGQFCRLCVHDPRHGTYNGYNNLWCRCDFCAGANAEYHYARVQERKARPTPTHVHGTPNGYHAWGCRCDPCRLANNADSLQQRHRREAGLTDVALGLMSKPRRRRPVIDEEATP